MAFLETPRFPENVSLNFTGGPEYLTEVVEVNSGDESRNEVWRNPRHRYEVSRVPCLPAQWQPLRSFFHVVGGRKHGFRLKDPLDYQCPDGAGIGVIGTGVGDGYPSQQLGKKYTQGVLSRIRDIQKPVTTVAPAIYKNGVLLLEGTGPGQETPDLSTGLVSFTPTAVKTITGISNANPTVVTAPGHGYTNGKLVYLAAVAGMVEINSYVYLVAGATTDTFQLTGIDSTNFNPYTSGGTASLYMQPTDVLTWVGEFDVACRFDTDQLKGEIVEKNVSKGLIVAWSAIPIIEIRFP